MTEQKIIINAYLFSIIIKYYDSLENKLLS